MFTYMYGVNFELFILFRKPAYMFDKTSSAQTCIM